VCALIGICALRVCVCVCVCVRVLSEEFCYEPESTRGIQDMTFTCFIINTVASLGVSACVCVCMCVCVCVCVSCA